MSVLLPIFYLPPISWMKIFVEEKNTIVMEKWEHFVKQTYRNRAEIYGANGVLPLIIPIKHKGRVPFHQIEISYAEPWQKQHWKSIKNAYQSSPYFEFYESELLKIFENEIPTLFEFNLNAMEIIQKILKINQSYVFTSQYLKNSEMKDFRDFFSPKEKKEKGYETYYQIFSDKMGFIEDLSILDLICHKGPESLLYLKHN